MFTFSSFTPLCLHASLPFTLAVMGGVAWGYHYSQASFYLCLPAFLVIALIVALVLKRKEVKLVALLIAGFAAGTATINYQTTKLASYSFCV